MHSKEGRHICEAVGKRPNKNLQRFRLQLQHKFVLSVRNKQNSFKYVIQLVRVWKRGIRCCVGKPASKSQILATLADLLTTVYVHFKIVFSYVYIHSKSQELFACHGASNSREQKEKSAFKDS